MDGPTPRSRAPPVRQSGADLARSRARGDFNGDGKSDILWQNNDGTAAIWLMDGPNATFAGAAGPPIRGRPGTIKGTGDFNGDGKSDILWQNDDGTPAIWLMDGTNAVTVGAVGPSIQGRAGTSKAPAISTATASPTFSGRTTTARRRSGSWTA